MHRYLIPTAILRVIFAMSNEPLTSEQSFMTLCLKSVLHQHLASGFLLVSLPTSARLSDTSGHLQLVDFILGDINRQMLWSLNVFEPDAQSHEVIGEQIYKPSSYIIFVWPEQDGNVLDSLVGQLQFLQSGASWNSRARFVVMVTERDDTQLQLMAFNICEIMWEMNRIVNVVILVRNSDEFSSGSNEGRESGVLDVYTWFPYRQGSCAEPAQVVLVDRCLAENNWQLTTNLSLFPNKIPKNLLGCHLRVSTSHLDPYVILKRNYTEADGKRTYKYEGFEIEYVYLLGEAINMTVEFLPPAVGNVRDTHETQLVEVLEGVSDVAIGQFPLSDFGVLFADPTVPFAFDALRWYIPCPGPASRMQRILGMYSSSVWITMLVIISLTALVLWRSANSDSNTVTMESHNYRTLMCCAYNVWSVFMGVSVPKMPRSPRPRTLFLFFVCYSFVMNVVFQSFFISFVVNPGLQKPISTFDELIDSNLIYAEEPNIGFFLDVISYSERKRFGSKHAVCGLRQCLERLYTKGDVTTVTNSVQARYIAAIIGRAENENKLICTLNENVFSLYFVMYVQKGNPLLEMFNVVIRRGMEAGLVEKYMSEQNCKIHLQNAGKSEILDCEACSEMFLVFSFSHLTVAFLALGLGHILSVSVFLAELASKWYCAVN